MGYAPCISNDFIPSIGCPMTFIIRPLICSPAGITIGDPVCFASNPRCSPSVLSIATQRTVSSPICCCTSTTSSRPSGRSIFRASWILGNTFSASCPLVSKNTSMTGPIIWEMCPLICAISCLFIKLIYFCFLLAKIAKNPVLQKIIRHFLPISTIIVPI